MNDGCHNRRYTSAIALAESFECNTHMTVKTVWRDEKDFTLDVPVNLQNDRVYGKGKKPDVPGENLLDVHELDVKKSYGFRCNLLVRRQERVFCEWKLY